MLPIRRRWTELALWHDVLVQAEQVVRVVPALEVDQPGVALLAVGAPHRRFRLGLTDEVEVLAVAGEPVEGGGEAPGPGPVAFVVGGIAPHADHVVRQRVVVGVGAALAQWVVVVVVVGLAALVATASRPPSPSAKAAMIMAVDFGLMNISLESLRFVGVELWPDGAGGTRCAVLVEVREQCGEADGEHLPSD